MTKLFLIGFLFFSQLACAQSPKQTELFSLMKAFMPDSTINTATYDWHVNNKKQLPVAWLTDSVEFSDNKIMRRARTNLTVNGRHSACNGNDSVKSKCEWSLTLYGDRTGYFSFTLVNTNNTQLHEEFGLADIFGAKGYTAAKIASCDSLHKIGFNVYELSVPGKKKGWLKTSWVCNAQSCYVALVYYTYRSGVEMRCLY